MAYIKLNIKLVFHRVMASCSRLCCWTFTVHDFSFSAPCPQHYMVLKVTINFNFATNSQQHANTTPAVAVYLLQPKVKDCLKLPCSSSPANTTFGALPQIVAMYVCAFSCAILPHW